jgi:signal recognition particle receptor subunit beta
MNARILYWGIAGAGKTTNLTTIHAKLRADHRGELHQAVTRLDPTVTYEVLPIQLGEVGGIPTEIEIVTVPDGPEQAPTRKQLLDEVNGIVLVIDASPARTDENVALRQELAESLASYGRELSDLPIVVQYNKRDLVDDNAIEALHRKLALPSAAVFEAIAIEGTGVLQTLTTVSKAVVKNLRDAHLAASPTAPESVEIEIAPTTEVPTVAAPPLPPDEPIPVPAAHELSSEPEGRAQRERNTPADVSTRLLENAMAAEAFASPEELDADAALAQDAQASFDQSFEQLASEDKKKNRLSLGPDLRIVSVGSATRHDERSVRVPLVLGDADGATASIALTISLDGIVEEGDE